MDLSRDSGNVTLLDASNFKISPTQQNMFMPQVDRSDSVDNKSGSQRALSGAGSLRLGSTDNYGINRGSNRRNASPGGGQGDLLKIQYKTENRNS